VDEVGAKKVDAAHAYPPIFSHKGSRVQVLSFVILNQQPAQGKRQDLRPQPQKKIEGATAP